MEHNTVQATVTIEVPYGLLEGATESSVAQHIAARVVRALKVRVTRVEVNPADWEIFIMGEEDAEEAGQSDYRGRRGSALEGSSQR